MVQMQNVCADKMTSVPKLLVKRARGTVMMTLNVKDHLYVDTLIASTVQLQTVVRQSKSVHIMQSELC